MISTRALSIYSVERYKCYKLLLVLSYFQSFDIVGPDSGFLYVVDTGSTAPWPTTTEEANFVNRVGQCMIGNYLSRNDMKRIQLRNLSLHT